MKSKKIDKVTEGMDEALFTFAEGNDSDSERIGYSNYSYWRSTWKVFV